MDPETAKRLVVAVQIHAATASSAYGLAFLPTFLVRGFFPLAISLYWGIFLTAVSQAIAFFSLVLIARPDSRPLASVVRLSLIPSSVRPTTPFKSAKASEFLIFPIFLTLVVASAALGVYGPLHVRSSVVGLSAATLPWASLVQLSVWVAGFSVSFLVQQKHILLFPILQRRPQRRMKLALPEALLAGSSCYLLLLLFFPGRSRSVVAFFAGLQLATFHLARAALEVPVTH